MRNNISATSNSGKHTIGTNDSLPKQSSPMVDCDEISLDILEKINFKGMNVLIISNNTNPIAQYVTAHHAATCYEINIIEGSVNNLDIPDIPSLIDVILLLDVVQFVPRQKMDVILKEIATILSQANLIAVKTPIYQGAPNVINNATSNNLLTPVSEDPVTTYNTYTLKELFLEHGYYPLSEAVFFTHPTETPDGGQDVQPVRIFRERWDDALARGIPLIQHYSSDKLEFVPPSVEIPAWHTFTEGMLKGLTFFMTDSYRKQFIGGNYDMDLFEHISSQTASDHLVIFDVGGFLGISSFIFSRLLSTDGRVICFEPNPWNIDRINLHLSANQEEARKISLYQTALGESNTTTTMLLSSNVRNGYSATSQCLNSDGTINSPRYLSHELGFFELTIPIITLDSFIEKTGIIPDIIKVDIEGAEAMFLLGALNTLRTIQPKLYIEMHSNLAVFHCMRILNIIGYKTTILRNEPSQGMIHVFAEKDAQFSKTINPIEAKEVINNLDSDIKYIQQQKSEFNDSTIVLSMQQYNAMQNGITEATNTISILQKQLELQRHYIRYPISRLFYKIGQIFKKDK